MSDVLQSGMFRTALEIGVFEGWSSTVFIHGVKSGKLESATFCDPSPQPAGREVLSRNAGPGINMFEGRSVDILQGGRFDFILVDGCHRIETVKAETQLILKQMPLCVFAHDTSIGSIMGNRYHYHGEDGPVWWSSEFSCSPDLS